MHHGQVSPEIAGGLLALKARISAARVPPSKLDETINIAVWNIREFGKKKRLDASLHYIAEIIGQFDLVALVELRDNLEDLGQVMEYLGPSWKVLFSDWTDDSGGNDERTAFLFDRRAVTHNGLAAEIDAPRVKQGAEWVTKQSFWRAPYLCSFRAGNFDFLAIAMHARWGDSEVARQGELQLLRRDRESSLEKEVQIIALCLTPPEKSRRQSGPCRSFTSASRTDRPLFISWRLPDWTSSLRSSSTGTETLRPSIRSRCQAWGRWGT